MFGDAIALSYSDFLTGATQQPRADQSTAANASADQTPADVITTQATAASVRNVAELQARIKAGGGVLTVNPNSSDYIVAVNNKTRFSVTRNASGQFEIRESQNFYYLIGVAVLIGVLLLAKK